MGVDQYPISNIQHLHTSTVLVRRVQIYPAYSFNGQVLRQGIFLIRDASRPERYGCLALYITGIPIIGTRESSGHSKIQASQYSTASNSPQSSLSICLWLERVKPTKVVAYNLNGQWHLCWIRIATILKRRLHGTEKTADEQDMRIIHWVNQGWLVFWSRPSSSPNHIPKSIREMETKKSLSYRTASVRLGIYIGRRAGLQSTLIFEIFMTRVLSHTRGTF